MKKKKSKRNPGHYSRAVSAIEGLNLLEEEHLLGVENLGKVIGQKNAYKLLAKLYRAASRETTYTHTKSIKGLYSGREDRLKKPLRKSFFGYARMS